MTKKAPKPSFKSAATDSVRVFVVKYNEHEYEQGWGVTDRPSHLQVYGSLEAAQKHLTQLFPKSKRSLLGAGDFFTYPNGPDDTIEIYEVQIPAAHKNAFSKGTIRLVNKKIVKPKQELSDELNALISKNLQSAKIHTLPMPGLNPKPIYFIVVKTPEPSPV